jgi:hypothetical protein
MNLKRWLSLQDGYDIFDYKYQAHMFKRSYANVYLGGAGFPLYEGDDATYLAENPSAAFHQAWPYHNIDLVKKWNWAGGYFLSFKGILQCLGFTAITNRIFSTVLIFL